jgi:cytochrome P450
VNTFLFAGSDTTSLALTWTFYLLAAVPAIQQQLRTELMTIAPSFSPAMLPDQADTIGWQELWNQLDELPYLQNVIRESLRLIPPVHSSIRVAMKDDEIPTSEAVKMRDGSVKWGVKVKKGQLIHIPVESMALDKSVWGEDAWYFK